MYANLRWPFFGLLVLLYCLLYAPYGINETDGGFVTGLAWQVLNGKVLYQDVVYIRPPLPIWLRCLELSAVPEEWAVLVERYCFYLKVAAYSLLGAAALVPGQHRWWLTLFGFVLSVHCYPPAAWHTTDGILFGVLAVYLAQSPHGRQARTPEAKHGFKIGYTDITGLLSGMSIALALGCKQSFYPLLLLFFIGPYPTLRTRFASVIGFLFLVFLFLTYLIKNNLLSSYLSMTGSAASGGQAFQHGVVDYFKIQPILALVSAACLATAAILHKKSVFSKAMPYIWFGWLCLMAFVYVFSVYQRQAFTIPFAQSRLLFWVAAGYAVVLYWRRRAGLTPGAPALSSLLLISWCAAVSWGYNLPILFATPWVFAAMVLSQQFWAAAFPRLKASTAAFVAFMLLLCVFRYAYEFVYRDGPRSDMKVDMGTIFPKLRGIRSSEAKAALYRDFKNLSLKYGPAVKTLPSFPAGAYLGDVMPVLPLDWVVEREMGGSRDLVLGVLTENKPILLVEKQYEAQLTSKLDPELKLTQALLNQGHLIEETSHFWVVRL